eukprot:7476673-Alexandrium_andersonii.AAC.1
MATSWDYSSAFDRVDPRICCAVWQELGVPQKVVSSLLDLWTNLSRVLEYKGEVASARVRSPAS